MRYSLICLGTYIWVPRHIFLGSCEVHGDFVVVRSVRGVGEYFVVIF